MDNHLGEREKPMDHIQRFWQAHGPELHNTQLNALVRYAMTLQVSSAAAERVFSFLKSSFDDNQELALEDYVQLSMMLRFNQQ
jgi:hypothetical protein